MLLMDEMRYLRLYSAKRKVYAPIDVANRKKGAAIMLLTRDPVDSYTLTSLPYVYNPKLFQSLYIDRNVTALINSGVIIDEDPDDPTEEAVTEAIIHSKKTSHPEVRVHCHTQSINDDKLVRTFYTEKRFRHWFRYFKARESQIPEVINIEVYPDTKSMMSDTLKQALAEKDIALNSYSTEDTIYVVANSGFDKIKAKEGKYDTYLLNELITFVCMRSSKNCSRSLACYVGTALSGKMTGKFMSDIEDDYENVGDSSYAVVWAITKMRKEEGDSSVVALVKSGDFTMLRDYAGIHLIKRMVGEDVWKSFSESAQTNYQTIEEGYFIGKNDTMYNINQWQNGKNILYVTGLSGGGKSTIARNLAIENDAVYIELDMISHLRDFWDGSRKEPVRKLRADKELIARYAEKYGAPKDPLTCSDAEYEKFFFGCFDYLLKHMKSHPDQLYVVEGIQVIRLCKEKYGNEIFSYPLIIKNTSMLSSILRRIKRDGEIRVGKNIPTIRNPVNTIKYWMEVLEWYLDQEYSLNCLRKAAKAHNEATYEDVMQVVNSLSAKEKKRITYTGEYVDSPNVIYRDVYRLTDGQVMAFIEVFQFKSNPDTAQITVAVSPFYRGKGAVDILLSRLFHSNCAKENHIDYYVWCADHDNIPSINIAKRNGFVFTNRKNEHGCYMYLKPVGAKTNEYAIARVSYLESVGAEKIPLPISPMNEAYAAGEHVMTEEYIADRDLICFFNGMDTQAITEAEKKWDAKLKKYLFKERLKNNKMVLLRYQEMKAMCPWIKYTYLKLPMYKGKNIYIDLSFYHGLFLKHLNVKAPDQRVKIYWDFLNRLIAESEYETIYKKMTIFLPAWPGAWGCDNYAQLINYRESVNPIAMIMRMLKKNPDGLKKWGDKDIVFVAPNGYFKVNFNTFSMKNLAKFKTILKKLASGEVIEDENDEDDGYTDKVADEDSSGVVTAKIADKIEQNMGIELPDLTGGVQNKWQPVKLRKVLQIKPQTYDHLRVRTEKIALPVTMTDAESPEREESSDFDRPKNAVMIVAPSSEEAARAYKTSEIAADYYSKFYSEK